MSSRLETRGGAGVVHVGAALAIPLLSLKVRRLMGVRCVATHVVVAVAVFSLLDCLLRPEPRKKEGCKRKWEV